MKEPDIERMKKDAAEGCNSGAVFSLMFTGVFIVLSITMLLMELVAEDHSPWWLITGILGYAGGMALVFFIYYLVKRRELRFLENSQSIVRPVP